MIRNLHHVSIHTKNLDAMIAFYRDAFGFEVAGPMSQWEGQDAIDRGMGLKGSAGRMAMLKTGNCFIEVWEFSAPPGSDIHPKRPNDRGYTHFCVEVPDLAAEQERLEGLGMTFATSPFDDGPTKAIYGRDIDGNIIELLQIGPEYPFRTGDL